MTTFHLLSCVSKKRGEPAPAHDLYVSDWFRKARTYVERQGGPWAILSAEHGLVLPETVIAPYERTLNRMPARERRAWAERVEAQLAEADVHVGRIVVLAGIRYREYLLPALERHARTVEVPMAGLGIGRQLAWLKARA